MKKLSKVIFFSIFCISIMLTYHNSVSAESITQTINDNEVYSTDNDDFILIRDFKDYQVGDSYVISENEDGILRITCIEAVDTQSRSGSHTSQRTFNITNSLFGIDYHVVTVETTCYWYADGANGYVQNLIGSYSDVRFGWSCAWEPYQAQYNSQYVKTIILDIYHGSNTYNQFFSGAYNPFNETLSIDTY